MKKYKFISILLLMLSPLVSMAQEVEMADNFRKEGKIYVVVTIAGIILAGIFIYLILLDTKVSKIEKQIKQK